MSISIRTSARPHARLAVATVLAAGLTAVGASAASAHVTVKPESTTAGSFSQLVFRVPNESDTASAVKVKVTLPTAQPLLHVSTLPIAGWSVDVQEAKLPEPVESYGTTITKAPSTITWDATGGGVKPGEYQTFAISAGPLPESGKLVFPTVQTYSDGEVSRWTTVAKAGEEKPEHPAPAFTVTASSESVHDAQEAAEIAAAGANVESSDSNAMAMAVIGLVAGVLGLVLAGVALARGRRSQEA